MQLMGLIPARAGSKRVPRKNIRDFCGAPLISYTCEAARTCNALANVFVSTDSDEIASICGQYGVAAPYRRAPGLAEDSTPMAPVVVEFVEWCRSAALRVDAVVLLQPTSPLRTAEHIDSACRLFTGSRADTVVSVTLIPHSFHPRKAMGWRDGTFGAYLPDAPPPGRTCKIDEAYGRNGPAILITKSDVVRAGKLYGEKIEPFIMSHAVSVDIDTEEDLKLATLLYSAKSE